jgi:hypothetical protein
MANETSNEHLKEQEAAPQRALTLNDVDMDRMRRLTDHGNAESVAAQRYRQVIESIREEAAQTQKGLMVQINKQADEIKRLKEEIAKLKGEVPTTAILTGNGHPLPEIEGGDGGKRGGKRR